MARNINTESENKIVQWEGEILHAYDDFDPTHKFIQPGMVVRGTLTAGVGHTGPDVYPGLRISLEQSRQWLRQDIDRFEALVERSVKVPLSDNQFGALVSFAFNVGEGNFLKSTLLKKLNKGDYDSVPSELNKWIYSKKKRLQGLVNRRAQEGALWGKGDFVASASVGAVAEVPATITKENIGWGAGILSTLGAALAGTGPLQWAFALILVVGFGVGLYLFLTKRLAPR